MHNIKGNLFTTRTDALVITTNGFVKNNGACVMGRGCAKRIQDFYPTIAKDLGLLIKHKGNIVHVLPSLLTDPIGRKIPILSFPVKPISAKCMFNKNNVVAHMRNKFKPDNIVPGWACVADLDIIKQSALKLLELTNEHKWNHVLLPRPGCGAGELSWKDVEPILQSILDDRFYCITY